MLRRVGFKSKGFEPRPVKRMDGYTPRARVPAVPRGGSVVFPHSDPAVEWMARPKFDYVRSRPLLDACHKLTCQHCRADDGTIVAAHSNWPEHGKGGHIKASDVFVAALCFICHVELDQGLMWSDMEKRKVWWRAHQRTVPALQAEGLWPDGVPLPNVLDWPFPFAYD